MQTVAPSGTTWGQYVRTRSSFVDPKTGFLSGPWGECIAWAVIYEHAVNWDKMPQYPEDGVVGPVLKAFEEVVRRHPSLKKANLIKAADMLEDAAHEMAMSGLSMPDIKQVVLTPKTALPGDLVRCENPQAPGSTVMVKVAPSALPELPMLLATPVQPSKSGLLHSGMVTFAVGARLIVPPGDLACTVLNRDAADGGATGVCCGEFAGEGVTIPDFLASLF